MTRDIRVLLIDDQPTIRKGIRLHLDSEPGITVIGEAGDGISGTELVGELDPDVVVLDISMPGMDGFDVAQHLCVSARCGIVMLSLRDDTTSRARAELCGAHAFVSKHEATNHLVEAIRKVADQTARYGTPANGGS